MQGARGKIGSGYTVPKNDSSRALALDPFSLVVGQSTLMKQSDFRQIMRKAKLEVKESNSVLENPSHYFDDDEELNSTQRDVVL